MVDSAIRKGSAPEPPSNRGRRPILTPQEVFEAEPIEWLIEGLLPKTGVGLISGASGSFKSYIAGYLVLCVANGNPVSDRCGVQRGRALFAAHEGYKGMARRMVAAAEHHQLSNANVGLWEGITLSSDTDVDWLLQNTEPWRLVVIDTLSKATSGIDENSNAEMALAIERAYRLANAWNCFVAIVAHTGKDETRGTRGASALKANVDSVLAVRRSGNSRHVSLTIEKQKDADDHLQLDFKMEATEVIHTETGEVSGELVPVTTGSNPSADACIRIALARDPELAIAGLVLAVTEISRAGCYRPVTPSAIKVAAGRAVKAGTVVKIGEKYSLSPDAAR